MSVALPAPPVVPVAPSRRGAGVELARQSSALSPATQLFRSIWFALLLGAICFEGLGRRYLPNIPGAVFYFLKDVVLIVGLIRFRIHRDVLSTFSHLYRGFMPIMKLGLLWTFAEIVNPDQKSIALGVLGFRAYWFWWIAPLVVASVLLDPVVRKKVVILQASITIIVSIFAMLQFGAPVDDSLNTYSVVDGEEVTSVAVVTHGPRARVVDVLLHHRLRGLRHPGSRALALHRSRRDRSSVAARGAGRDAVRRGGAPHVGVARSAADQHDALFVGGVESGSDLHARRPPRDRHGRGGYFHVGLRVPRRSAGRHGSLPGRGHRGSHRAGLQYSSTGRTGHPTTTIRLSESAPA